jgi:ABC-type branched-subunit amino acid transport system permease subunit
VRGVNLAVLTLSAGVAAESIYFSNATYVGGNGTPTVMRPTLFGVELGIGTPGHYPRPEFVVMLIVVAVPLALAVVGVRRSSIGLQMLAVRANERAAAANGINVALIKVIAFGMSAFLAGLAGAFIAYLNYGGFSSASFDPFLSLSLVASVFIVGITSVSGAVLAAFAFAGGLWVVLLQRYLPFQTWYGVFAGAALILSAVTVPEGIAMQIAQQRDAIRLRARGLPLRRRPARVVSAASLDADTSRPVAPASVAEADESTSTAGAPGLRHE